MYSDKPDFKLLDHTADMGIIVRGSDPKDLFEGAARSMLHIMLNGTSRAKAKAIKLQVEGEDLPDLMVRWLGEILYLFEAEKKVTTDVKIDDISSLHLNAILMVVPFDPNLHEILCEIKAVTYHQIEVTEKGNAWETRIIFDL